MLAYILIIIMGSKISRTANIISKYDNHIDKCKKLHEKCSINDKKIIALLEIVNLIDKKYLIDRKKIIVLLEMQKESDKIIKALQREIYITDEQLKEKNDKIIEMQEEIDKLQHNKINI